MRVTFKVPGKPQGKGRPRFSVGRNGKHIVRSDSKTSDYESLIAMCYVQQIGKSKRMHEGPLLVTLEADYEIPKSWSKQKHQDALSGQILPTVKPDLDNVIKCLDALNGIAWHDDAQIIGIIARKRYSETGQLQIAIEEAE